VKLSEEQKAIVAEYGHMFNNTGGNDIVELIERDSKPSMKGHTIRIDRVAIDDGKVSVLPSMCRLYMPLEELELE